GERDDESTAGDQSPAAHEVLSLPEACRRYHSPDWARQCLQGSSRSGPRLRVPAWWWSPPCEWSPSPSSETIIGPPRGAAGKEADHEETRVPEGRHGWWRRRRPGGPDVPPTRVGTGADQDRHAGRAVGRLCPV